MARSPSTQPSPLIAVSNLRDKSRHPHSTVLLAIGPQIRTLLKNEASMPDIYGYSCGRLPLAVLLGPRKLQMALKTVGTCGIF